MFGCDEFQNLAELFHGSYAGYKPEVREAPNGDANVDMTKRYLHVALKYDPPRWACELLARAHFLACAVAEQQGVPDHLYPKVENGTLRVLEYPSCAGSAEHCDFDLFTLNLWRSPPNAHEWLADNGRWMLGAEDFHWGEIGELCGLGGARLHRVTGRPSTQQAIVYFAMPAHKAILPTGQTTLEWLTERVSRSRIYV